MSNMIVMNPAVLYDVFRQVRPLHQLSAAVVTTSLQGRDVSMPMRAVLERLYDDGPQTVPQLGRALWITRQGVQAFVDEAKRLGYVEAQANPAHRRSHIIALTEAGRAVYEHLHAGELDALERLGDGLDEGDVDACVRVLTHLVAALRAHDDATEPATSRGGVTRPGSTPTERSPR